MNYKPIDYKTWNFDGTGKNIKPLLSDDEKKLWDAALEFQDSRKGEKGHAETVTYFAINLILHTGGKRQIIVPSAILHDIGWSKLHPVERQLFYIPQWERYESILRQRHQEEGEKLAKEILRTMPSFSRYSNDICEIISQHDTRKGFLSQEDMIMRSADVLWRFTPTIIKIGAEQRNWDEKEVRRRQVEWKKSLGNDVIREIADIEAENSFAAYKNKLI